MTDDGDIAAIPQSGNKAEPLDIEAMRARLARACLSPDGAGDVLVREIRSVIAEIEGLRAEVKRLAPVLVAAEAWRLAGAMREPWLGH